MSLEEEITRRIRAVHPEARVELNDMTGTADHWQALIVAPTFEGMSRIQRQRSVYAALGELMHGPIHALTMNTQTPAEAGAE